MYLFGKVCDEVGDVWYFGYDEDCWFGVGVKDGFCVVEVGVFFGFEVCEVVVMF